MSAAEVTSSPPVTAASAPPRRSLFTRIPANVYSATLISLILVSGELLWHIVGGFERFVCALGTALLTEAVLSRLLRGKFANMVSAYISGNSVVILAKPAAALLWPFYLGAFISVCSKYVLKFRGRHLWNPTNFGMCAMLLLAPHSISILSHQWGSAPWVPVVIYSVGFVVVTRAKVRHITLTYVIAFAVLAFVRSGFDVDRFRTEVAPLTGAMYTLFNLFMVTDPRTIVPSRNGQYAVCILVAILDNTIRWLGDREVGFIQPFLVAPPMFALFVVGPIALWLALRRQPIARSGDMIPGPPR